MDRCPHIAWLDETTSTNRYMSSCATALPHGAVVAARSQTAGRGQRGNSWEAEPGANLTFSILLRPEVISAAAQFELSMLVSLAVCKALTHNTGISFQVKWPNDIYAGDSKVCGILIENSLEGNRIGCSIVGIGINVNQRTFVSDAPNPVSLRNLTSRAFDLQPLLEAVCTEIINGMDDYESHPDAGALVDAYSRLLWRGNGWHRWHDTGSGTDFEGCILSVAPSGILSLRDIDGNVRRYAFKEVSAVL